MSAVDERLGTIVRSEVRPFAEVRKGYTYFAEGDVLFAKITPCMQNGKHAIARNLVGGLGFGTTEFHVLRPVPQVMPEWIHYYLRQPAILEEATAHFIGSAGQQRLPDSYLTALEIPLPPLEEQKRIAAILNEQMAAVERARAAAEAQLEAATALPATYLRAIFNSPEAQRWPRQRLGDVCELLPSKSIATDGDAKVLAVTTACLTEAGFDPSGVKSARMWTQDVRECLLSPGEILVARSNTSELVGRVAMYEGNPAGVVASDLTIRIRTKDSLEPSFLTAHLSFLYVSAYWKDRAGGASGSMKKITRSQIEQERVPIPSMPEQQRIVADLTERMRAGERTRKTLEEQLAEINALPAAFLRQAFSGKA